MQLETRRFDTKTFYNLTKTLTTGVKLPQLKTVLITFHKEKMGFLQFFFSG